MVPIVSFVGRHNAGKTTLVIGVIRHLKSRGIKTAVIKHAAHGVDVGNDNDSDRLFNSGADLVYTSSPDMSLIYRRYNQEKELEQIYAEVAPGNDLIICEGFKKEKVPKIEVLRKEITTETMELQNVIARAVDFDCSDSLPLFGITKYDELAEFIINAFNL